jgi:glutathionylspermidine synthase
MKDIGWDSDRRRFVDLENRPIVSAFKLYPWEWLISETFGEHAIEIYHDMQWIEPIWKMLLSNKGILSVLWELFPDHPNLLEARLGDAGRMRDYIRKPLLSREGANVRVVQGDAVVCETDGDYGDEGYVFQQWHEAELDGRRPVIGSWVIDGQSAGIGIRETGSLVTDNLSSFVPHVFHG